MRGWRFGLLGLVVMLSSPQNTTAQTVTPCPNPDNCAQVSVMSQSGSAPLRIPIFFRQGPTTAQSGGIDKIAALAFSLGIGTAQLADCSIGDSGLPGSISLNPSVQNFRVVVENATCANGRTHCLCPDAGSGITPDSFVNFVIYGPNPLPTPGPNPVDIPTLPVGPQELLTVDLKGTGTVPLHIYTETKESTKPQFTAYLSVGDKLAVDQTCVPVSGQPPCSSAGSVSQVAITDGAATFAGGCVGDCNGDGEVTVDELLKMVNISLGNNPVTDCPVADANNDGEVTIDEIIQAVNSALTQCPNAAALRH
ncbi:MAG: hypothetical protein HY270_22870 [Deltaproteobacteria bacterium]|nr:hypothetical protein [Deltaproteobacteria bacterium]